MTIIVIILLAVWCYSYFRFRQEQKYFSVMAAYLQNELQQGRTNTTNLMLRLSSALIQIQHYKDAYDIYQHLGNSIEFQNNKLQIETNIKFCIKPFPGCNGPKNFNHSYWHNFVLVRLGGKRYNFLSEDDFLRTNSLMRNMK